MDKNRIEVFVAGRPHDSLRPAFAAAPAGEARPRAAQEVESSTARCATERPLTPVLEMLEAICDPENDSDGAVSTRQDRTPNQPNRRARTRTHGDVGEVGP
jgi:hypothetical protein